MYFVYAEAPDTGMECWMTVWGLLHVTNDDAKAGDRSYVSERCTVLVLVLVLSLLLAQLNVL